jgi:tRNA modification GTPase
MLTNHDDPIVSIATAPGRGAVGIVRVSGRDLAAFVMTLLGRSLTPRQATYLPFKSDAGEVIDQGLAIYFPAPHSYTGEDVLELQAHGGPVVLNMLVNACLAQRSLPNLRLAEPGEFTQRAFLNDKMDLTQAEAVSDLIDASTSQAVRSAARSLSGAFSDTIADLRAQLVNLRMLVESTLDFPEEEIDFLQKADAVGQLTRLRVQLQTVMRQTQQGVLLREGIKVVIAGQPNAGKSSLLNALAGAELAIVTPIAGTTRDVITQTIQINGVPVHILDTAGLRDSDDTVEQMGITRAWAEIARADAVVYVYDCTQMHNADVQAKDQALRARLPAQVPVVAVWNKADVVPDDAPASDQAVAASEGDTVLTLSAKTGEGLDALRAQLLQWAGWEQSTEGLFIARQRHLTALAGVETHLELADGWLNQGGDHLDLLAEELRLAQVALGEITGEFNADDLLGEIFSRFCIGK